MSITVSQLCALMHTNFSDRQLEAIVAPCEPAVIMAGAGSGKTSVMTARIVWLVANGVVQSHEVLGLTFTNKAAAEFRSRVQDALARAGVVGDGDGSTIATYHSFAQQLIIDDGIRIGVEPEVALLTDVRREQLAMQVVRRPESPILELSHSTASVVSQLLALDGRLAEEAVAVDAVREHDIALLTRLESSQQQGTGIRIIDATRRRLELLSLVEQFRALKTSRQVIDYADLMRLALRLVEQRPDVRERLRTQFRVVLLDEYQDTSVAQRMLMQTAFGDGHPVTAVGDALQAIYEWRGANAVNIVEFPRHFPRADGALARVFGLPTTQRFGPGIAQLANDLTSDLRATLPGVEPLEAADALRNGPGLIDVALHEHSDAEFAWVAAQLQAAHVDVQWQDMAVLLREHRHASAVFDALTAANVPAQIVGKQGLLLVPDIADIVAYLRVMHDPAANPSWVRILTGPRYRIGARDLARLGRIAADIAGGTGRRESGWRAALDAAALGTDVIDLVALGDAVAAQQEHGALSTEAQQRLAECDAEIRALRRLAGLPIGELVRQVSRRIGLEVEVDASERAVARGRRANLEAFLELVASFSALDDSQSLSAFLRWLDDGERMDQQARIEQPVQHGAVSIMTMHAAKGLQWKVVALPAMVDGSFPSNRSEQAWPTSADALPYSVLHTEPAPELCGYPSDVPRDKDAKAFSAALRPRKLAEETRLAYVAVTRAEQRLIASAARRYGDKSVEPSPFLLTIREAVAARGGTEHCWADEDQAVVADVATRYGWPQSLDPAYERRLLAAAWAPLPESLPEPDGADRDQIAVWDRAIAQLTSERLAALHAITDVPTPVALTATEAQAMVSDPDRFLSNLVRPMPRGPAPAASRGSAFHAWVEQQFAGQLVLTDDATDERQDDAALGELQAAFDRTEWARRTPLAVEVPFVIAIGAHVVRGRIDAVYRDATGLVVVDWKTNAHASSDPMQLAIYRLAAARRFGVAVKQIRACFVYVAQGRTEWHDNLPDVITLAG